MCRFLCVLRRDSVGGRGRGGLELVDKALFIGLQGRMPPLFKAYEGLDAPLVATLRRCRPRW